MKAQLPWLIARTGLQTFRQDLQKKSGKEKESRQGMKTGRSQLQVKAVDAQTGNSVKAQISEAGPRARVRFRTKGAMCSSGMWGLSGRGAG